MISGPPIHIRSGQDYSLTGVGWDRPDLISQPERAHANRDDFIFPFFNTAAFIQPRLLPAGLYGNAGRGLVSGPGLSNTDFSALKDFRLRESWKIQFRAEFFNIFNHTQFFTPDGNTSDGSQFGQVTQVRDPRLVQFALRLVF